MDKLKILSNSGRMLSGIYYRLEFVSPKYNEIEGKYKLVVCFVPIDANKIEVDDNDFILNTTKLKYLAKHDVIYEQLEASLLPSLIMGSIWMDYRIVHYPILKENNKITHGKFDTTGYCFDRLKTYSVEHVLKILDKKNKFYYKESIEGVTQDSFIGYDFIRESDNKKVIFIMSRMELFRVLFLSSTKFNEKVFLGQLSDDDLINTDYSLTKDGNDFHLCLRKDLEDVDATLVSLIIDNEQYKREIKKFHSNLQVVSTNDYVECFRDFYLLDLIFPNTVVKTVNAAYIEYNNTVLNVDVFFLYHFYNFEFNVDYNILVDRENAGNKSKVLHKNAKGKEDIKKTTTATTKIVPKGNDITHENILQVDNNEIPDENIPVKQLYQKPLFNIPIDKIYTRKSSQEYKKIQKRIVQKQLSNIASTEKGTTSSNAVGQKLEFTPSADLVFSNVLLDSDIVSITNLDYGIVRQLERQSILTKIKCIRSKQFFYVIRTIALSGQVNVSNYILYLLDFIVLFTIVKINL